jgi:hypothetical protein
VENPSTPSDPAPAPGAPTNPPPLTAGGCVLAVIVLLGLALASPVLMAKESVISVVILGFALWEAWKFNRGITENLKGPYRIGPARPPEAKPGG